MGNSASSTLENASTACARIDAGTVRTGAAGAEPSVLELRYPGVVRALTLMWGHPELSEFLGRVAAGLDVRFRDIEPAAMAELMLLGQLHRAVCPPRAPAVAGSSGNHPSGTLRSVIRRR